MNLPPPEADEEGLNGVGNISTNPGPLEVNEKGPNGAGTTEEVTVSTGIVEGGACGVITIDEGADGTYMAKEVDDVGCAENGADGVEIAGEKGDTRNTNVHPAPRAKQAPLDAGKMTISEVITRVQDDNGNDHERVFIVSTIEALESTSIEEGWVLALKAWALFEQRLRYPASSVCLLLHGQKKVTKTNLKAIEHKLIVAGRPPEVKHWIQRHRLYNKPPTLNTDDFAESMRIWVLNIMPDWHCTPYKWPLNHIMPTGGDWSHLMKGGANGIVMVLIALSWGLQQAKVARTHHEILSVVEDMAFVLHEMSSID